MEQLQSFDLLFVKGESIIGRAVQHVTDSPYSHVAIVIDPWHVVETNWRYPLKVRHIKYRTDQYNIYRYKEPFTLYQLSTMEQFLRWNMNTPYDTIQSLTNGLYLLTGLPIRDAPERMNCSETVDRMFAAAGIDLSPEVLGHVTPADLARSELLYRVA